MNPVLPFLAALAVAVALPPAHAAEPFLKPHDVIALVGGEDLVAASEYGYLELLLQRALPDYRLKVRSLAWEGDTVFAQPRDLNYPTLEAQLEEVGATVVILQFGQMESLAGTSKLPEFIAAYEKLIERVSAGGKRRVVIVRPTPLPSALTDIRGENLRAYAHATLSLGGRGERYVGPFDIGMSDNVFWSYRDTVHLDVLGQNDLACRIASRVLGIALKKISNPLDASQAAENTTMLNAIRAKNRLWFHYTRPQNWAFLNGDRTEQPSSRDYKDPSKRWFPEEMKQWLPLIDAKEKEIWALAAKAAKP